MHGSCLPSNHFQIFFERERERESERESANLCINLKVNLANHLCSHIWALEKDLPINYQGFCCIISDTIIVTILRLYYMFIEGMYTYDHKTSIK